MEVYAEADEVALVLNGREVARGPVGETLPNLVVFDITHQPGTLTATAYREGAEAGRWSLESPSGEVRLGIEVDRATITADPADLAYVTLRLTDPHGVLTGPNRAATVSVAGPGELAGMCSGDPRTRRRFDADSWETWDGRALAVVRPTGAGTIELVGTAEGARRPGRPSRRGRRPTGPSDGWGRGEPRDHPQPDVRGAERCTTTAS